MAQYALYKQYAKAMYNICLRITNDEADAADILQEAFLKVFDHLSQYKGDATIGAWIKRIVINQAISHLKKKRLSLVPLDEQYDHAAAPEAEDWDLSNAQVTRVQQQMQLLPEGYRLVLSLYLLEGYDHKEIASILGITESTSKSQYNRAKKKLRTLLEERTYNG